ncbi:single-stranded DNA binding protein [uncultured Caudovirales phage]|uniref:Single-stranded DNA-binding protein n=1 Tax=uncultured Caudovirales phage TaxID=2100421 RepID=A0A6J5L2H3_9CAUD|nr:single-stranded DNA binding protein [uncultured Caudovirales phage]
MSLDINALRKSRSTDFSKITSELDKIANPQSSSSRGDERLWKLEGDKAGNGTATIRFLPRVDGDEYELPWVKLFSHGFQGPTGKWYIENSLTTIGKDDPVGELNTQLWNSGVEANKEIARKQKRGLSYYANILVVSDPKHPENEGKVFIFRFGKKIFDKIMDKAKPTFEDETPVNIFDLWEGANFKFRMRKVAGYSNYDESIFSDPTPITEDETKLLAIMNARHNLQEYLLPSNFKTYDELKKKLDSVLAGDTFIPRTAEQIAEEFDVSDVPNFPSSPAPTPTSSKPSFEDDDEDTMAYFAKLAAED